MSAKLAMHVFESALPAALKPTAAVFALFAFDDGSSTFPSLARVAWSVGVSVRQVRKHVSELCALGILVPSTQRTGGARPTRYTLRAEALPARPMWSSEAADDASDPGSRDPEIDVDTPPTPELQFRGTPSDPGTPVPGTPEAQFRGPVDPVVENPVENLSTPIETPEPQFRGPRSSSSGDPGPPVPGTPELQFRRSVSDQSLNGQGVREQRLAPRCTDLDRQPNGDNYRVILKVAHEVLEQHPYSPDAFGDFVDAVKWKCAELKIIYGAGRHPDVDHNVTHRACASALVGRLAQRCADAGLEHAPGRRRARRAS